MQGLASGPHATAAAGVAAAGVAAAGVARVRWSACCRCRPLRCLMNSPLCAPPCRKPALHQLAQRQLTLRLTLRLAPRLAPLPPPPLQRLSPGSERMRVATGCWTRRWCVSWIRAATQPASAGAELLGRLSWTEPRARLSWSRTAGPPQLEPNRWAASAGAGLGIISRHGTPS